jgi:hypothetical protein
MSRQLNRFLDWFSNFLAHRKGLLPLIGLAFILLNFVTTFVVHSWVTESNLFLHIGLIVAILGFLLAWAL